MATYTLRYRRAENEDWTAHSTCEGPDTREYTAMRHKAAMLKALGFEFSILASNIASINPAKPKMKLVVLEAHVLLPVDEPHHDHTLAEYGHAIENGEFTGAWRIRTVTALTDAQEKYIREQLADDGQHYFSESEGQP